MKILFLDIDGVLNCKASFSPKNHTPTELVMINRINQVLITTGCKIVVSSSWRILWNFDELKEMLSQRGLKDRIIDVTPRSIHKSCKRQDEIQAWLDKHPEVTKFAIVDDEDFDLQDMLPNLVKTSLQTGIQDIHVEQLINLLN